MDQDEADAMLMQDLKRNRSWRVPMYAGLVVSGIFVTVDPSELVAQQVSHLVSILWAVGMIVSAAICLYGAVTDKWIGEYTGIPLLASVLMLYGGSAILATGTGGLLIAGYGLTMVSFSCGLVARWFDVRKVKQNAGGAGKGKGSASGDR